MRPIGAWYEDPAQGDLAVAIVDIGYADNSAACVHEDGSIFIIPIRDLHVVRLDLMDGTGTYQVIEEVASRLREGLLATA